ncbi:hypothetical protein LCGC14_2587700 [marine sediment metagenome]|uniref:Uncharacterized protein n=1 Tax=marine sediment metagenome TaxID=412755 RepID=A0A0F9CNP6_9ZZZZ
MNVSIGPHVGAGRNPDYDPRADAIDAIAEHLAEDDTAYTVADEAIRQAERIMKALDRRGLRVVERGVQ